MSDRVQVATLEERMDDVRAVMDAAHSPYDSSASTSVRGVHTGEVEVSAEGVTGLAVQFGARVMGMAGAGEILATSTVKDLVAGAGIEFEDRGTQALKGVPTEWRVFAVLT